MEGVEGGKGEHGLIGRWLRKPATRRSILKAGGSVAGGGLLTWGLHALGVRKDTFRDKEVQSEDPAVDPFAGLSDQERKMAEGFVQKELAQLKEREDTPAKLKLVNDYQGQIEEAAQAAGFSSKLSKGVAFVENNGDPQAVAESGAAGIYMLKPDAASDAGISPEERLIPEKNIEGGNGYLAQNLERFGRVDLAILSHHLGPGTVYDMVRAYIKRVRGVELGDIRNETDVDKASMMKDAYLGEIATSKIAVFKLLSEPESVAKIPSEAKAEEPERYLYRVIAASDFVNQQTA